MAPEKSTRRLGRGLDALFTASPSTQAQADEGPLRDLAVTSIISNPFQPRKNFKPQDLKELQESLKANGLLQPITVRPAPDKRGTFELIAGERRLRAAMALGWPKISAVVKDLSDQEILTLALVENLQRSDLNPIEEAEGYGQLIERFGHTQQSVAAMVGKDRSTIANVLRVLQLPTAVRQLLQDGQLTAGQARPLLALENEKTIMDLARQIVANGLSAREVERRVRQSGPDSSRSGKGRPKKIDQKVPEIRAIEQSLRKHFQTDVEIKMKTSTKGSISVAFYSADDLQRIMDLLAITGIQH
ncbi:MAG: ParB/RepB/Spo0J family partition protein [Gemmatimonadaceae bacterium]